MFNKQMELIIITLVSGRHVFFTFFSKIPKIDDVDTGNMNPFHIEKHQKEVQLLQTICTKILEDVNNDKYKDLSLNKITSELNQCKTCINLLYNAGFYTSDNGKRLLFDITKINELKSVNKILSL